MLAVRQKLKEKDQRQINAGSKIEKFRRPEADNCRE
jgi:hypothetical protein